MLSSQLAKVFESNQLWKLRWNLNGSPEETKRGSSISDNASSGGSVWSGFVKYYGKRSCHFSPIRLSYRPWSEGLLPSTEARAGSPGRHERAFRSSLAPQGK
jgi:hypothetical protein